MDEHEPSTSASTLRGLRHLDMALLAAEQPASSPAPLPAHLPAPSHDDHLDSPYAFRPSSPHSAYASEPGSPSGDSVSSFPSVGSSFLFSSVPVTPPHPGPHSDHEAEELGDSTSGLVIPSLVLPSPSRRPTAYGQTLGEVRLLLLAPRGVDASAIASQLVDDNEDVVEVGLWEQASSRDGGGRGKQKAVLRVSTDWVEHRDRHGLERVEPARNVEIVELPSYDTYSECENVLEHVLPVIHAPFYEVLHIINREHPPSGTLAHLLSSSSTPLHTALILLSSSLSLSPNERSLIESLSPHIPVIVLPPSSLTFSSSSSFDLVPRYRSSHLSSFRPTSLDALRAGLFRTPNILATLRAEAASRFLRWREVERAVERVQWSTGTGSVRALPPIRAYETPQPPALFTPAAEKHEYRWDKEAWEAQWEGTLSQEVALHLRRRRSSSGATRRLAPLSSGSGSLATVGRLPLSLASSDERGLVSPPCTGAFDPLHLPSLAVFSLSLLRALGSRAWRTLGLGGGGSARRRSATVTAADGKRAADAPEGSRPRGAGYTFGLGLALVSAFCAGIGIGLVAATGRFGLGL